MAQLIAGVVAETVPDQPGDRGLPQRPGPKYRRAGLECQRSQILAMPVSIGSDGHREDDGQARQPVREVKQEPQRRLVGPLGVVDGQ